MTEHETERLLATKHKLTDKERNDALRLLNCGLSPREIAEIMHISKSSVSYIRQAHTACLAQDWSTLQSLSTYCRATVDWAMRLTGTDKTFIETFGEPKKEPESAPVQVPVETISKDDFKALSATLQDICYLLTEIRDLIK